MIGARADICRDRILLSYSVTVVDHRCGGLWGRRDQLAFCLNEGLTNLQKLEMSENPVTGIQLAGVCIHGPAMMTLNTRKLDFWKLKSHFH